jgi:hypothetical protein
VGASAVWTSVLVADFMFDLDYPDIISRFRAWKRFWNTTANPWHEQLLQRESIGWILEKKNESLLDPATVSKIAENTS